MVVENIGEIISVFLLSSVKFGLGGVPLALTLGFPFFKAVVTTSTGGMTGVTCFVYLSDLIIKGWHKLFPQKQSKKPKKIFTLKNKLIVKVKRRFGLIGIALITPSILSIPLGSLIAVRYFHNKKKIILYFFTSVFFWSISLSAFKLWIN